MSIRVVAHRSRTYTVGNGALTTRVGDRTHSPCVATDGVRIIAVGIARLALGVGTLAVGNGAVTLRVREKPLGGRMPSFCMGPIGIRI